MRETWRINGSFNESGYDVRTSTGLPLALGISLEDALLIAKAPDLERACRAVLLYFSPSPWTKEKCEEWQKLVVVDECTSKSLCDMIRKTLEELK